MQLTVLIVLAIVPTVYCACNDNRDCQSCASSSSSFISCRWCEATRKCHAPGSIHNNCKKCEDNTMTNLCSVTDSSKCVKKVPDSGNQNKVSKSGLFHPKEAFSATLYSALAYTDKPVECVKTALKYEGIEIVSVIGRMCNYLFRYKECLAITAVSHSTQKIILAYRGTTSTEQLIEEFTTTFLLKPKVPSKVGGKIQEYFGNAHDQLYSCVKSSMANLIKTYPKYSVIVAGHSLGGAIASIASARLVYDDIIDKKKTTLYTFGMPRPGDRTYAKIHDVLVNTSWRIVHDNDIVPHLPNLTTLSNSPYHHQREIFYGKVMNVDSDYTECFDYEDDECSRSVSPSTSSINNHKTYYGINVESHCDENMHIRQKRTDADSDMRHHFTFDQCKIIHVAHLTSNGATVSFCWVAGAIFIILRIIV